MDIIFLKTAFSFLPNISQPIKISFLIQGCFLAHATVASFSPWAVPHYLTSLPQIVSFSSVHPCGPLQTSGRMVGDLAVLQPYTYDFHLRKLYESMQSIVLINHFPRRISSEHNLPLHL